MRCYSIFLFLFLAGCAGAQRGNQNLELKLRIAQSYAASDECFEAVAATIKQRLDYYGIAERDYKILTGNNNLTIKIFGIVDSERTTRLLTRAGNIGFWETYENTEVYEYLAKADKILSSLNLPNHGDSDKPKLVEEPIDNSLIERFGTDTTEGNSGVSLTVGSSENENPLFSILSPAASISGLYPGPVVGYAAIKDTARVNEYLAMDEIRAVFPRNLKLLWGRMEIDAADPARVHQLVAIKVTTLDGTPPLNGQSIIDAHMEFSNFNDNPEVSMTMGREGADTWQWLTSSNIGRSIAITVDNLVYSFPTVQSGISGGRSAISGNFTIAEAEDLAVILRSKPLPCEVNILSKRVTEVR